MTKITLNHADMRDALKAVMPFAEKETGTRPYFAVIRVTVADGNALFESCNGHTAARYTCFAAGDTGPLYIPIAYAKRIAAHAGSDTAEIDETSYATGGMTISWPEYAMEYPPLDRVWPDDDDLEPQRTTGMWAPYIADAAKAAGKSAIHIRHNTDHAGPDLIETAGGRFKVIIMPRRC